MLTDNPILYREWLALKRRRKASWLSRLTYPALLVAPTLLILMLSRWRLQDAAEGGFACSLFLHCLYVCLRAISSTIGTVAWEKESRTFDVLVATPMRPSTLLGGKYLATQVPLAAELLAWAPAWLVFWLLGAARPEQLAQLVLLTVGLQALFSSLGLWGSLTRGSAEQAGRLVYGILATLTAGDGLLYLLLEMRRGWEVSSMWSQVVNPFFAAGTIVWGGCEKTPLWLWFTLICLLASPVLLLAALRRFESPEPAAPRSLKPVDGAGPENPVDYRGWLARRRHGFSWLTWVIYPAVVLGPVFWTSPRRYDNEGGLFVGLTAHILFFSILALARASSRVARERERGAWEGLMGSLVTGRELYRSELSAVTRPLLRQLALTCPMLLLLLIAGKLDLWGLVGVVLYTVVSIYLWASVGLFVSQRCSSSLRALQVAIGCLGGIVVAPIVLDLLVSLVGRGDMLLFSFMNPVMAVVSFTGELFRSGDGLRHFLGWICAALYALAYVVISRTSERDFTKASGV